MCGRLIAVHIFFCTATSDRYGRQTLQLEYAWLFQCRLELRVSASTQESHIDIHLPELRMKAYVIHSLFSPSVYLSMECKNTISFSSNHTLISYASPDNTFYSAHRSPLTASVIKQRGMGDTTIYVYPSATTPVCKVHRSHPRHPRTIACHHLASFAQCQPQANPREPRRNLS